MLYVAQSTGGEITDQNELKFEYGLAYKHNFRILGTGTMFKIGYTGPIRTQDFTTGKIKYGGSGGFILGAGYGPFGLTANNMFKSDMSVTFNLGPLEWDFSSTGTDFGLNLIDIGANPGVIGVNYKYYLDMSYDVPPTLYQHPMHALPDNTRVAPRILYP